VLRLDFKVIRATDEIRNICYEKKTLQVMIHKEEFKCSSNSN